MCAPRRSQICRVCSRRSRDETPAPKSVPGNVGQLPARFGQRPLEYPTAERHHHPALECQPAAPAEESNSLTTAGSRAYRGCFLDQPRTPQSTSVYSSRSLVGLYTLEGLPQFPLRDLERLCLVHGLLPLPDGLSWPMVSAEQRSSLAPAPLQGLPHYYGLFRPCASLRYFRPHGGSRLWLFP